MFWMRKEIKGALQCRKIAVECLSHAGFKSAEFKGESKLCCGCVAVDSYCKSSYKKGCRSQARWRLAT